MKKYLSVLLALLCLLSLCACSGKEEPAPTPAAETEVPVETETPAAPVETPAETPAEPEPAAPSAFELAKALEGESVDELLAAVGEPVSREDYAPSCLGDGEDGLWHYEGFDVYTYREGGSESVYAVEEG